MKKSDLKNRMVVENRRGKKYIVIDDKILSTNSHDILSNYNEDLTNKYDTCFELDIIKVYDKISSINFNNLQLVWERTEVKEVTMAEVEKKFGCKVKIIKE